MARPIRVLELRSVRGTGGGPEKTILLGAQLSDPSRFRITVCYIRDRRDRAFDVATRAKDTGIDYVDLPERHSFDLAIWPALRRLVVEHEIDIVHAHDYKTDLVAWLLSKATRAVPLSTAHGWAGDSRRERFCYYPADKLLLARYPHVIAVSQVIKQEILNYGARSERVTVILNAIDSKAFKRDSSKQANVRGSLHLPEREFVIGAVGRLEQEKRFDLLLRAAAALPRNPPPWIVIAGEGSQRATLEQLARELGLADRVRLLGQCSNVSDIHHAFDVLVQSSEREGTPNAVLEAMALETPIVATDVGGTRELVTDRVHALLVPYNHVDLLTLAISDVCRDRHGAQLRAAAARDRVEKELSFEGRMRRLEAVYEELAALSSRTDAVTRSH